MGEGEVGGAEDGPGEGVEEHRRGGFVVYVFGWLFVEVGWVEMMLKVDDDGVVVDGRCDVMCAMSICIRPC